MFPPKLGEDEPILTHIFQMGWNHHQLAVFGKTSTIAVSLDHSWKMLLKMQLKESTLKVSGIFRNLQW